MVGHSLPDQIKVLGIKVGKKAKLWNRYNQVQHLTQDTVWESDKNL